ncbi:MAG: hypothetical protein FJY56_08595 [Betaproteobacteria bacterium]|nr:hypothetical protein [Betaproteobacteria bacterium]
MAATLQVYDPIAPCLTQPQKTRHSLDKLAGKTIGFIDNAKPNFNHLVQELSRELTVRHGVKAVVTRRKRSASQGVPEAALAELVTQTDAVVAGSGD